MALFNRLKSFERDKKPKIRYDHSFGRYNITGKVVPDINSRTKAKNLFQDGKILESIESVLNILDLDNVKIFKEADDQYLESFELLHGTRKITCSIDNNNLEVICRAGIIEKNSSKLFRLLLQNNLLHQYSTYVINDNEILLKFNSPLQNLPPEKLYNGLKELALKGDKMAQFLPCEFSAVRYENDYHIKPANNKTKKVKTEYLLKWTDDALNFFKEHDIEKENRIISCYLFNYLYRVDLLLVPWYKLLIMTDKIISAYHHNDRSIREVYEEITGILQEIKQTGYDELSGCFIEPVTLFDMPHPASNKQIISFLKMQINDGVNIARYYGKDKAVFVFEHAAGYCFNNFLMNPAMKRLLFLFIRVLHPGFFKKLGFKNLLADPGNKMIIKENVEEQIRMIISEEKNSYPYLNFFSNMLKYHTLYDFAHSFFNELIWLNFKKTDE